MNQYPMPLERLRFFQQKLGVDQAELAALAEHRQAFIQRRAEFGRLFWDYFWQIERTRTVLEHDLPPRHLEKTLGDWFGSLFRDRLSESFIQCLWSSGVKHVQANLDQRYINLGYSLARQFCHRVIGEAVPEGRRGAVARAVDKLMDFCVLVATDSYITMTSRCDRQVIQGIAHQVRNPITVIGGNIRRLQREAAKNSPAYRAYDAVLEENKRLERMVRDVGVYTRLFQSEPNPQALSLFSLLRDILELLGRGRDLGGVDIQLDLDPALDKIFGDPQDLEAMFEHLLENCLEALDPADPRIILTSRAGSHAGSLEVELFNTGNPPPPEEIEFLFAPFHSSKPKGTGFGLPIAAMAVQRNLGSISLEPAPQGGALCRLRLPLAAARDS